MQIDGPTFPLFSAVGFRFSCEATAKSRRSKRYRLRFGFSVRTWRYISRTIASPRIGTDSPGRGSISWRFSYDEIPEADAARFPARRGFDHPARDSSLAREVMETQRLPTSSTSNMNTVSSTRLSLLTTFCLAVRKAFQSLQRSPNAREFITKCWNVGLSESNCRGLRLKNKSTVSFPT